MSQIIETKVRKYIRCLFAVRWKHQILNSTKFQRTTSKWNKQVGCFQCSHYLPHDDDKAWMVWQKRKFGEKERRKKKQNVLDTVMPHVGGYHVAKAGFFPLHLSVEISQLSEWHVRAIRQNAPHWFEISLPHLHPSLSLSSSHRTSQFTFPSLK